MACFEGVISVVKAEYMDLAFGQFDQSRIFLETNMPVNDGLMVSKPCSDPELARRLYRVMLLGHCSLIIPGEEGFIVTSAEDLKEMPKDARTSLGPAKVASTEEAFLKLYHSA